MCKNFPKFMNYINPQIQEAQWILTKTNIKKTTRKHHIIKGRTIKFPEENIGKYLCDFGVAKFLRKKALAIKGKKLRIETLSKKLLLIKYI